MAETNESRVQKSGALPSTAKGTTFTISIPIRLQTPPEKEKLENPGKISSPKKIGSLRVRKTNGKTGHS